MESAETIWDRSHNTLWGADSSTATHGTSAGQASKRRIKRSAIKRFQRSLIDAAQTIGWPNTHGDKSESPATPQRFRISVSTVLQNRRACHDHTSRLMLSDSRTASKQQTDDDAEKC